MRRSLMAAACLLPMVPASPAAAQFAVIDPAHITLQTTSWATQAKQMAEEIQEAQMRYRQLVLTYEALTRITDLGSAVGALNTLGVRFPLPMDPYAIQALLNGTGGAGGAAGALSTLLSGVTAANRVFELPEDSWLAMHVNQNGGALAGMQAAALDLYRAAAERVPLLAELQARIDGAPDPSEREALIARFGAEQAQLQNVAAKTHALSNYMAAQFHVREQQREEVVMMHGYMARDRVLAEMGAGGGGTGAAPAPAAPSGPFMAAR